MNNNLYILDGHGQIFRSYYAHSRAPLKNRHGENTSAIFGFFQAINKIFNSYKPMYFLVALDEKGPSFRNNMYKDYKATRQKTPEDLITQSKTIVKILQTMQIPYLSIPSMEADDIIASVVDRATKEKIHSVVISSDKDLFQLLSKEVTILRPTSKSSIWEPINVKWLQDNWLLTPNQICDYLAIVGDSSDNVPGIAGLGPKSAVALLQEYHSFSQILENIDSIKDTWRKKLYAGKDNGLLSYELVTLKHNIEIPPIENYKYTEVVWELARDIFIEQDITQFTPRKSTTTQSNRDTPILSAHHSDNTEHNDVDESPFNTIANVPHDYKIITNHEQLKSLITMVRKKKIFSIDTETDSLDSITAIPIGISISTQAHGGWYIPLKYPAQTKEYIDLDPKIILDILQGLLDGSCTIVMHNAKFDIAILENWGLSFNAIHNNPVLLFDTMVAAWMCLANMFSYSMDDLSRKLLSYSPISYKSLTDDENNPISFFSQTPLFQAVEYAVEDTDITLQLYYVLKKELENSALIERFTTLEMPFLICLQNVERQGISLNSDYMNQLSVLLAQDIVQEEKNIHELCGEQFNINSTKQLQEILFNKLQLPKGKKNKTGYSTDIGVLEYLSNLHPVPRKILNYRHLSKLKSTYTDTLPLQIHPQTNKIHTSLQQTGSSTGRIASINPNLQNIPVKDDWGKKIRSAFIASKGNILISADYSQIELMVLAHLAQDPNMLETFNNKVDIHKRTASLLFAISEDRVTNDQRQIAKTINFGVIYGMSAFRLSNELQIPQKEAKLFIESYFTEFAGITTFIADTIARTKSRGYSQTILGHRCYISHINSGNHILRKSSERVAVNSTIQGSAADIVKLAMLKVQKNMSAHKLKGTILLQIHDELLIECPINEETSTMNIVKKSMESAYTLSIPLQVSIASGNNWGSLK